MTVGSTYSLTFRSSDLSLMDKSKLDRLKSSDQEIRIHENTHLQTSLTFVRSAPEYTYERGPDGKYYVVAGEVDVDSTPPWTPEQALSKATAIQLSAMATKSTSLGDASSAMLSTAYVRQAREVIMGRTMPKMAGGMPSDSSQPVTQAYQEQMGDPLSLHLLAWA